MVFAAKRIANRMVQRSRLRSISVPPEVPPASPTPNAPDMPASLPECSSTRKITPTERKTSGKARRERIMPRLAERVELVQPLEQVDRLGAQRPVQGAPVAL